MGFACLLVGAAAVFTIPSTPTKLKDDGGLDWPGVLLGVTGLVLVNVAWDQGPPVGWETPYVYILLTIGLLALVAFCGNGGTCSAATDTYQRAELAYYLWFGGHIHVMVVLGHLAILPLAIPGEAAQCLSTSGHRTKQSLRRVGLCGLGHNMVGDKSSWDTRDHGVGHGGLLGRQHSGGYNAPQPNLLDTDIIFGDHRPLGDGYVLPGRHDDVVGRHATRTPTTMP
ncbi:aminotriazole resistance protein [Penicillium sp. CMV-2018d]|nr:aminotriazole resistance protein [Penicillium sp. CMV-2018d]